MPAALKTHVVLLALASLAATQSVPTLRSRAESTDYVETTGYEDVMRFARELDARSTLVRLESFGQSEEGRDLPLIVLGEAGAEARPSRDSRPTVFVLANIHAGEVEGKEAALHLARRLATGDLRPLLDRMLVLVAPIYNADGNEKVTLDHRTMQNGPVGGVGSRENARGLDLNRDFIKLESREARALVASLNRWDPDLVIDLHTTNGSYHGYHLTYSPTLNPNADGRLIAYARERMLPAVQRAVADLHRFRTYYYGNFATREAPEREVSSFDGTPAVATRIWRTFDHRPRFGNNYVGLRNRLTILSEAYSYLDFRRRVAATEAFVEETLKYTAARGDEMRRLVRDVDRIRARGPRGEAGVAFELRPLPQPVEILVGQVEKRVNPRSGREMLAMVESAIMPVRMPDYGSFEAVRRVPVPEAYLLTGRGGSRTAPAMSNTAARVKDVLLAHGLRVDELTKPAIVDVERLTIAKVDRAARPFQGHREVTVGGTRQRARETFASGTLVVSTRQPLGALAFYLLDPESDDGLTKWNFFDDLLVAGKPHPVARLMDRARLSTRAVNGEGGSR